MPILSFILISFFVIIQHTLLSSHPISTCALQSIIFVYYATGYMCIFIIHERPGHNGKKCARKFCKWVGLSWLWIRCQMLAIISNAVISHNAWLSQQSKARVSFHWCFTFYGYTLQYIQSIGLPHVFNTLEKIL